MTSALCPTCMAPTQIDAPSCARCGQPFTAAPAHGPASGPAAGWGSPVPPENATIFTDPSLHRIPPPAGPQHWAVPAPMPEPSPAPPSSRRPLLLAAAIGLPVLAVVVAIALIFAATSCQGASCTATATSPDAASPPPDAGAAPAADSTETTATPATPNAPTVTPGAVTVDGNRVRIDVKLTAPADALPTTCSATADGVEIPFTCAAGKVEYEGNYNTQGAVTIKAANAAGVSGTATAQVDIPYFRAVIIHACSPPPCEPVSTHQAPYRNTNERPGLLDGTPLEIECWVEGDTFQTQFHEAGRPTRSTRIFYRMHSPNQGRYLWAPFVVERFEEVVPGVAPC